MDDQIDNEEEDLVAACSEENELLNATSIKMAEAPFGRSESDDDIVEDYDDSVSFKTPCCKGRTPLETLLLILLVLSFSVIIALAVGLTRPQIVPVTQYCQSPACVKAAGSLLSSVDWSVDPCDDFYQFACGHWLKTHPIPRGYRHWDRFQELSDHNLYVLSNLIDSSSQSDPSFQKTRQFYQSCMGVRPEKKKEILDQFQALIDDNGGWSYSHNSSLDDWTFMVGLESVHRMGAWPLFKLTVEVDEREPTKQNIIKIDIGETMLPPDLLPFVNWSQANTSGFNTSIPFKDAAQLHAGFMAETIHLFSAFGAQESEARATAEKILEVEKILTSASVGLHSIHNRFKMYNVMTVAQLVQNFSMIEWSEYFTALGFSNIDGDTDVVVLYPSYMAKLNSFFHEYYHNKEKKSILRDYLALSLVRSFRPFFDKSVFEMLETEEEEMEEPWKRCTFYTNKALGFATGALYVKGTDSEGSVEKMEKLITYVKNAFKDFLLNKYWIDKRTRTNAEKKVDAIIDKISYPSFILNTTFLNKYYENFQVIQNDWFSNLLSWRRFLLGNMNYDLQAKPDRQSSWLRPPVTVNAYYSPTRNDVIFPIAMFHLPFYIPDGPSAVNFGAMGSIIGHEITHAFDFQGRQYDGQGKLTDWWEKQTASNFLETTTCMKEQYGNIKVRGVKIDGDFTLDENIADNGGLRAAMYAYQLWIDSFGEEKHIAGVNMTMYQVFYTSFAQMYCSKWTDAGLFYHLLTDPHSPGSARVNGALSNSQTFNWAFQCEMAKPMNPRTKCEVW
ncbi:endothelin-converting enzyme homolog isoform X4 [Biomphalaria glabrata]|uniref:Endothelin-converting enzyme homolog isoform X4 n=1 Tax=Biomphalaria glabrata TaxID=6526 RepID=A0A9W2YWA3_BIOGL|nr:endothelin-converting enzyme homolog isoform X4 [Biomphalaria glabrata]